MQLTAREIADFLQGEIVGDADVNVSGPARIEYARPGDICFYANPKYEKYVYSCKASIILVNKTFAPSQPVAATMIKVEDAYRAVTDLLTYFQEKKKKKKMYRSLLPFYVQPFGTKVGKGTIIGDFVYMGKGVKVGRDCTIYPQVYLGDGVVVGDNTVLHPGVKVYHECVIGSNCIIHANAVIGADGFGFAPRPDGTYKKIPQLGNVVIEDDVEIGANTTVDRATMGSTIVHKGVKVDNLCQLAHNTEIGENTAMAAQTGIAGSTHIGESCIIAGQVGISGHITIAPHSTIGPQSGIMGSIKRPGQTVMGSPAFDYPAYMRASVKFKQSGQK